MKGLKFIMVLLIAVMIGSTQIAEAQKSSNLTTVLVQQYNTPEVRKDLLSDGTFSDFKCVKNGNDVVLSFTLSDKEIDLNKASESEKDYLKSIVSESFISGFKGNSSKAVEAKKMFVAEGVRFVFNFYDQYGNLVTGIVDAKDL